MVISETLVTRVDELVLSNEAPQGYPDVLKALSILMLNNENPETKKAAEVVSSLAEMLNDYLNVS